MLYDGKGPAAVGQGRDHSELAGGGQLALHLGHQESYSGLGQQSPQRRPGHRRRQHGIIGPELGVKTEQARQILFPALSDHHNGNPPDLLCYPAPYADLGANMMMAMPVRATPEPTQSHRVGLMPSTAQSQRMATKI
ncbi:hypothetical protein D3C77_581460 [compost metagenome]